MKKTISARSKSRKDTRLKSRLPILFKILVDDIRESILNYFLRTPSVFAIYFNPKESIAGRSNNYIYFDDANMEIYVSYSKFSGKHEEYFKDLKLSDIPDQDILYIVCRYVDNIKDIPECREKVEEYKEEYFCRTWDSAIQHAVENGERGTWKLFDIFFDDQVKYSFQMFIESYKKAIQTANWKEKTLEDFKKVCPFRTKTISYHSKFNFRTCQYLGENYHGNIKGDEIIESSTPKIEITDYCYSDEDWVIAATMEVSVIADSGNELIFPITLDCFLVNDLVKVIDSLSF